MAINKCLVCGESFYAKLSQIILGWGKYCSSKCRSKSQHTGKYLNCYTCKKAIYRSKSQLNDSKSGKYFCNKTCQTLWRNSYYSEEKHPNWQFGQSVYKKILQRSEREMVCNLCGLDDKRILAVHHLNHNRKNNKIENLIWLCHNCHFLIHHFKDEKNKIMEVLV